MHFGECTAFDLQDISDNSLVGAAKVVKEVAAEVSSLADSIRMWYQDHVVPPVDSE